MRGAGGGGVAARLPGALAACYEKVNGKFAAFIQSHSADQQLSILKDILSDGASAAESVEFLTVAYLNAEPKHPVKCFLARTISKHPTLREPFESHLTTELSKLIAVNPHDALRRQLADTVSAIISCNENLHAGGNALKTIETKLVLYLDKALSYNVEVLRTDHLSPTDTNEVFTLIHNILRALLSAFQKVNDNGENGIKSSFKNVTSSIGELTGIKDVPMDTKCLGGILLVTILRLEHGPDYWIKFMLSLKHSELRDTDGAVNQVCLYSAVVTVVPLVDLEGTEIDGTIALVVLVSEVLKISERFSAEPLISLSVARTLLSLTKLLHASSLTRELSQCSVDVLIFVWAHVEHYMDSVRHLTTQLLAHMLKYFAKLKKLGDASCIDIFFTDLSCLPRNRKAYYVGLSALASVVGAEAILSRIPGLIPELISALSVQAVQSNVATSIETLLQRHVQESTTQDIYASWICPILERIYESAEAGFVDTATLNILENIIAKAIKWDGKIMNFILPKAQAMCTNDTIVAGDLKCVLVCLNVARKMACLDKMAAAEDDMKWRGVLGRDVIELAMVNASEEIRILALSIIVETLKSTESFTAMEFELLLWFLRYNANTQAPNVRHLTLSLIKKFMKRLNDSYRIVRRLDHTAPSLTPRAAAYVTFLNNLRRQCFDSLLPGTNYSRRAIALQILAWCENLDMEGYASFWCEEFLEKVLVHLEDSYESNKILSLEILTHCPHQYLNKSYTVSLKLTDILDQASSVKPPDCVSAAYKLNLIQIVNNTTHLFKDVERSMEIQEDTTYFLIKQLRDRVKLELRMAQECIMSAAARGPMYGLILCTRHLLANVNFSKIATDGNWTDLISSLINTSILVTDAVSPIVNNSSPEGHLPMDCDMPVLGDSGGERGPARLAAGRVTAQMVLLCAWRSVKEVSLLLGDISSNLHIQGEGRVEGNLTRQQVLVIGEHFTTLLAETKHRGAFEQAYVGFTKLCARLWKCQDPDLHSLPKMWLAELMEAISSGDKSGKLCATRRSAGVPFMIQALVTTELQTVGNPSCFHSCMTTLLKLASFDSCAVSNTLSVETRTHSLNILRAMFRHTALGEVVNTYVGAGLVTAILGFDGTTWAERNSSTLLFSSLMVRIFGVQRSKDSDALCIRNKMTGRTFFLRYPMLYDFMLEKLQEASSTKESQDLVRPSLYPILLLLARLYPYTLEECTTNLRLVAFIPQVMECGGSCVLKTRQLAAKALVPLISQEKYITHINDLLKILNEPSIKTNYCHGVLLQIYHLLESKPTNLKVSPQSWCDLSKSLNYTCWILDQAVFERPCYLTADEFIKVFNLIMWRFPDFFYAPYLEHLSSVMTQLLMGCHQYFGREVFLSNAVKMLFVILTKTDVKLIPKAVTKYLNHECYEVVLAVIDFVLMLYKKLNGDMNCKFLKHLQDILDDDMVDMIVKEVEIEKEFRDNLILIVKGKLYPECLQKSLIILSLQDDTQAELLCLNSKEASSKVIINELIKNINPKDEQGEKIINSQDNMSHVFILSLNKYVSKNYDFEDKLWIEMSEMLYDSCSSGNSDAKRLNVVDFLEEHSLKILKLQFGSLDRSEMFEIHTTLWATLVTLLEDDEQTIRQKTSDLVLRIAGTITPKYAELENVVSSRAAEILLDTIEVYYGDAYERAGVMLVLALMVFDSDVAIGDDLMDECRVFEHNEKYNIFLEESSWTYESTRRMRATMNKQKLKSVEFVNKLITNETFLTGFNKLCSGNFKEFVDSFNKDKLVDLNPKVKLCAIILRE